MYPDCSSAYSRQTTYSSDSFTSLLGNLVQMPTLLGLPALPVVMTMKLQVILLVTPDKAMETDQLWCSFIIFKFYDYAVFVVANKECIFSLLL